jgi:hypothetical protein
MIEMEEVDGLGKKPQKDAIESTFRLRFRSFNKQLKTLPLQPIAVQKNSHAAKSRSSIAYSFIFMGMTCLVSKKIL